MSRGQFRASPAYAKKILMLLADTKQTITDNTQKSLTSRWIRDIKQAAHRLQLHVSVTTIVLQQLEASAKKILRALSEHETESADITKATLQHAIWLAQLILAWAYQLLYQKQAMSLETLQAKLTALSMVLDLDPPQLLSFDGIVIHVDQIKKIESTENISNRYNFDTLLCYLFPDIVELRTYYNDAIDEAMILIITLSHQKNRELKLDQFNTYCSNIQLLFRYMNDYQKKKIINPSPPLPIDRPRLLLMPKPAEPKICIVLARYICKKLPSIDKQIAIKKEVKFRPSMDHYKILTALKLIAIAWYQKDASLIGRPAAFMINRLQEHLKTHFKGELNLETYCATTRIYHDLTQFFNKERQLSPNDYRTINDGHQLREHMLQHAADLPDLMICKVKKQAGILSTPKDLSPYISRAMSIMGGDL